MLPSLMFNRVRSVVERLPPISHYICVESHRLNAIVEMKPNASPCSLKNKLLSLPEEFKVCRRPILCLRCIYWSTGTEKIGVTICWGSISLSRFSCFGYWKTITYRHLAWSHSARTSSPSTRAMDMRLSLCHNFYSNRPQLNLSWCGVPS